MIASATGTFLFRQFFMTVPPELAEAARIDGAGPIRFFLHILLPLARNSMAALFVIQFIYGWNQYLWPLVVTTKQSYYTVVLVMSRLVNVVDVAPRWNLIMAIAPRSRSRRRDRGTPPCSAGSWKGLVEDGEVRRGCSFTPRHAASAAARPWQGCAASFGSTPQRQRRPGYAVAADHPMAGDDQGGAVHGAGIGHGAHGLRPADRLGDLAVGRGAAIGDLLQRAPDPPLKGGRL